MAKTVKSLIPYPIYQNYTSGAKVEPAAYLEFEDELTMDDAVANELTARESGAQFEEVV